MNCREAQELFGLMRDLPEQHPQRIELERHLLGCEFCNTEYHYWQESMDMLQYIPIEVTEEQAEAVNRRVMDRIYAESPWLAPDVKAGVTRGYRRRIIGWAASFLVVFLCSFIFLLVNHSGQPEASQPATGILPTAVAAPDAKTSEPMSFTLPSISPGIVEPFAAQMGPAYPQYWMLLSMAGMLLALISWKGIRRSKR
ncbi:zf-HC2 domain-containing protein [Paenibacillus macerans]|uniref:zf-HC2 domain-containing protein n=1 Tax=Paenibacillus macerans TaxID=44252 RepID=UPI002E1F8E1F|nr:zf-HC2 domain-containing protein [Paenibacillus macerans]